MCGIAGIISDKIESKKQRSMVAGMTQCMAHRGPDHEGIFSEGPVSLGHRRLSIIDLSAASNQPFFSADGRYAIVYNGELYNYRELKLELQRAAHGSQHLPYFFKSASDTEVVIAAYLRWGSDCLKYFNGMYAFAIYDTVRKTLFIARDRLGVKPLYYYYGDEGFMFASEIRAILHSGIKPFTLNEAALGEYFMYQTVFAPATIVKGIKMLMPGHYIEIAEGKASVVQYYDINRVAAAPDMSYQQACAKVYESLAASVQRRLVSDVPFGAFLSGGIDSSAVVALMNAIIPGKVQTFNVSFDESEFSEAQYARLIAKKFGTRHHEIRLTPADFLKQLPEALAAMDHPSGDGPNTFIVSGATKKAGITMALSGIGGDELFAGYEVFKRMSGLRRRSWLNAVPRLARQAAGKLIRAGKRSVSGNKIAELLSTEEISFTSAYPLNRSLYTRKELESLLKDAKPFTGIETILKEIPQIKDHLITAVSLAEIQTYLQNVLLRDTDQMAMAVALEVREPFLDHKLVELVLSLKDNYKYPHTPKKLLVDSLGDLLPAEIVNRPKIGFTLPWQHWMKHELKDFSEKNITELATLPFCDREQLLGLWRRFLHNDKTVSWSRIWHLVVLNTWLKQNNLHHQR